MGQWDRGNWTQKIVTKETTFSCKRYFYWEALYKL